MGTAILENLLFELERLNVLRKINMSIQVIHNSELIKTTAVLVDIQPPGALLETSLDLVPGQEIGLLISINSEVMNELVALDLFGFAEIGRIEARAKVNKVVLQDSVSGKFLVNVSLPGKFRISG